MATETVAPAATDANLTDTWTASSGTKTSCVTTADDGNEITGPLATGAFNYEYFTHAAISISASAVSKVSVTVRLKQKTGAGAYGTAAISLANAIRYEQNQSPTADYADYTADWLTNPQVGGAWTAAQIANAHVYDTAPYGPYSFGVRQAGGDASNNVACDWTQMTITYTAASPGPIFAGLQRRLRT